MKNIAKNLTLSIMAIGFIIGCIGPFLSIFDMAKYTDFLKAFAPWYMILITSIGTKSVVQAIQDKKNVG